MATPHPTLKKSPFLFIIYFTDVAGQTMNGVTVVRILHSGKIMHFWSNFVVIVTTFLNQKYNPWQNATSYLVIVQWSIQINQPTVFISCIFAEECELLTVSLETRVCLSPVSKALKVTIQFIISMITSFHQEAHFHEFGANRLYWVFSFEQECLAKNVFVTWLSKFVLKVVQNMIGFMMTNDQQFWVIITFNLFLPEFSLLRRLFLIQFVSSFPNLSKWQYLIKSTATITCILKPHSHSYSLI